MEQDANVHFRLHEQAEGYLSPDEERVDNGGAGKG